MRLSSKSRYGLRACFLMAVAGRKVTASELTDKSGISQKYLERIMTTLAKSGIVDSGRGALGGYSLAKPADKLSVGSILRALEDNLEITDCSAGTCLDSLCPNRRIFAKLYDCMNALLDSFTLADMVADYRCECCNDQREE